MKLSKLLGLLAVIVGAALIVGPWTFAYACKDMVDGEALCHTTRMYVVVDGVVVLLIGLLLMKVKSYISGKLLSLMLAVVGVITVLIPTYFAPVCKSMTMHCRTTMLPFIIAMGVILAMLGLLFLLKGVKKEKPQTVQPVAREEKPAELQAVQAVKSEPVLTEAPIEGSDTPLNAEAGKEAASAETTGEKTPPQPAEQEKKKRFWNF